MIACLVSIIAGVADDVLGSAVGRSGVGGPLGSAPAVSRCMMRWTPAAGTIVRTVPTTRGRREIGSKKVLLVSTALGLEAGCCAAAGATARRRLAARSASSIRGLLTQIWKPAGDSQVASQL